MKRIVLNLTIFLCCLFSTATFAFTSKTIDASGIVGTYYYQEGSKNQPAVVIWGGSDGGNFAAKYPFVMSSVIELVDSGYAVMGLSYFDYNSHSNIPDSLTNVPLEYFDKAFDWLERQPEVKKGGIAIYGTSRGAELALILATHVDKINVVIAGAPSSFVWGSFDQTQTPEQWMNMVKTDPCRPAWTKGGKPITNICHKQMLNVDPWYSVIDSPDNVKDSLIPVENSSAAILITSGSKDEVWPSTRMGWQILERLKSEQYTYPYKHIVYNTGHYVYNESWNDVLAFIKEHHTQ
ncbi:hypothetical protein L4D20_20120 [Vibrio kyushuensis]|uniref:acyl-CoA thioester hydrolase/BAAT C-terminal domain-containing protein n=1 Tax=Vibrio kyushuensis TaxID=2910249 RepID=UPI003D14BC86